MAPQVGGDAGGALFSGAGQRICTHKTVEETLGRAFAPCYARLGNLRTPLLQVLLQVICFMSFNLFDDFDACCFTESSCVPSYQCVIRLIEPSIAGVVAASGAMHLPGRAEVVEFELRMF